MIRLILVFFTVGLFGVLAPASSDPNSGFEEGLRLYRNDDMAGAIAAWEGVIKSNAVSGPLLYNLANAYYRQGEIGKSILYYERAKMLMPRDRDISANMDLVRLAITDRIEPPVRLIIWKWVDAIRDYFSLTELAHILEVLAFLSVALILAARLGPGFSRRFLRPIAVAMVICFLVVAAWYGWRAYLDSRPFAIVMADKTDIHSAPDDASQLLFAIHEGTRVRCGESLSGWMNIRLGDGRKGWMHVDDLEKI